MNNSVLMYLQFKRANGTPIERKVYSKLDFVGMVERLISKRPLSFYGARDKYLLRDGTKGSGKWELIGKEVNNWDSWSEEIEIHFGCHDRRWVR
jgi:hypothetical protein